MAQIHIAGHTKYQKFILDTHDHPVIDPVWALYARAIELAGPTPTLLEWDDRIPSFNEVHREALEGEALYSLAIAGGVVNLEQLQRAVFEVTRQPLTPSERMRPRLPDGRSVREIASALIKPNDRLTSVERLQIYNQQYWFRIMSSLSEDFPGLRSLIGERKWEKLAVAYLDECPSESYTLRNLGSRLESWLRKHRKFIAGVERVALDMVRLEWANIDAFDAAELPRFVPGEGRPLSGATVFRLQPHLHLLDLAYPVDDLLLHIRGLDRQNEAASNAVLKFPQKARAQRSSLPSPGKVFVAVYRLQGRVYFKRLTRDGFVILKALGEGKSLEQAIGAALLSSRKLNRIGPQLQEWFQDWSSLGWFAEP